MEKQKKEKEKDKEKEESKMLYLRAASIGDICRYACRFDFTSETLLLSKESGSNKLIALGERIDGTQIAYFSDTRENGNLILYEPATEDGEERVAFTSNTDLPNKQYINVMRADLSKFVPATGIDSKKVQLIKVENAADLVSAVIRKASSNERLASLYAFTLESERLLGAFDALDALSNDKPAFFFASAGSAKHGTFARYDYRSNVLDFSDRMEGHAYVYAKIINLAEPFPFLKKPAK